MYATTPEAAPQCVLLAEDNPVNAAVIAQQLALLGYTCFAAENGEKAWTALQARDFVALLTDCEMPVLDGYDLAMRVRADPRFATLPILALSARPDDAQRARCRASGMDDCLSKPVSNADLLRALRRTASVPRADAAKGDALQALQFLFPNPQALGAVLGQFVQATRKDLKELDTLHAAGAGEAFGRMLHRISGGLQMLDQREVAAVLDRVRRAGTLPTPHEYADLRAQIDGVVKRVSEWMRQLPSSGWR